MTEQTEITEDTEILIGSNTFRLFHDFRLFRHLP